MKRFTSLLFCAAWASLLAAESGCRSARDNQLDIMERELRAQEDYIYELEDYVLEYSEKLRQVRCTEPISVAKKSSVPTLSQPAPSGKSSTKTQVEKRSKLIAEPRLDDGTEDSSILEESEPLPIHSPAEDVESIEDMEVPELELEIGEPVSDYEMDDATPLSTVTQPRQDSRRGASSIPDPATYPAVAMEADPQPEADAQVAATGEAQVQPSAEAATSPPAEHEYRSAERLVITHVFRDSESDSIGSLLAVVEARDGRNEPADFNGKVSLMVMTSGEDKQRIKRWDFSPDETAQAWQTSHLGDGLHLELPLEAAELPSVPCELWARLETLDGEKILTQVPFEATQLATIDDAPDESLATAELGPTTQELAELEAEPVNPLRSGTSRIPTSPVKSTSLDREPRTVKEEPKWRAATHFSTGPNSGFATTASDQWSTTANRLRSGPSEDRSRSTRQQWTTRK